MATYESIRYDFPVAAATTSTQVGTGAMTLIKTLTASSSGTLSFVNGSSSVVLDNTYKTYIFKIINAHPSASPAYLHVNFRDGGSSYDATKTSSSFYTYHNESGSETAFAYHAASDLAQSTATQSISVSVGNGNDEGCSGELWLFNPSSTTYVKHFLSRVNGYHHQDYTQEYYVGGYCNVTAAIDAVQFTYNTGNIDSGTIKMYGIA